MVPLNFQNSNRSTAENSRYSGRSKENFKRTSGKEKNRKFGYTSQGSPLFWKFWKILFFLLLEVGKNSNRTFWLNGKCPWLLTNYYKNNHNITSVVLVLIPHHEVVSEGTEDRLPPCKSTMRQINNSL